MVPIELQQLREVQPVVSLPHISNHTLTTDFKMPQNYPIAQCVSKGAAYKTNTSIFSFYWLHSYHRLSQNSPIEATTGANCFNTYLIVQELPALVHWQEAPKQLALFKERTQWENLAAVSTKQNSRRWVWRSQSLQAFTKCKQLQINFNINFISSLQILSRYLNQNQTNKNPQPTPQRNCMFAVF